MPKYLISYDLKVNAPKEQYERLWESLRRLGARRVLFSQYALSSPDTSKAIYDRLSHLVDGNDRLVVTEINTDNWWGLNPETDLNTL